VNSNFAVIHFFWDRILGTYRRSDAGRIHAEGSPRLTSTGGR
jgi:sterol desaturase/sphingolipid hydroxylase (fatty acid hydroxylase superfamily)